MPGINTTRIPFKPQRSRVTRGFVEMAAWDQELRVCPPPDLVELAKLISVHELLWHPENLGIRVASDAEFDLAMHHRRLTSSPLAPVQGRVQTYGRRSVARLVNIIAKYRELCAESPEAEVVVVTPKDQPKFSADWFVDKKLGR